MPDPQNARTDAATASFWAKVVRGNENECWVWIGAKGPTGYGHVGRNGRTEYPHRVSYETANRPIPTGLQIDHLCRNRACVNPAHLEAVTGKENSHRSAKAQQTLCIHGHEFSPRRRKNGTRWCPTCSRERKRV